MKSEFEILRALRQPPMGKLVVQTGTGRFADLAEVTNDELRRRILAAIGDLLTFAGGYDKLVEAGFAPPLAPPADANASTTSEEALTAQQAAFIAQLEQKRDEVRSSLENTQASSSARGSLLGRLRGSTEVPPAKPAPATPMSIAEQLNLILQEHLAADPGLANRSIELLQAPRGGLQILVDGRLYNRPTEIEDRQVQAAIKRALSAWEKGADK